MCIGLFTLLNVLVGVHLGGVILWRALTLGVMDLVVAYGFFSRHRWLLYGFALNAAEQLALTALHVQKGGSGMGFLLSLLAIAITLLLCVYLYGKRRSLVHNRRALYTGLTFLLLWVISLGYTVSSLL